MSHAQDLQQCAAQSLLALGDRCSLCEHWEKTVGPRGGAPAIGDCTQAWDVLLRTGTHKACEHFVRDEFVEKVAKGEGRK